MTVLVTGAEGRLARVVARALAADADVRPASRAALDVTDAAQVRTAVAALRPDAIVNGAAWTDVDGAEADPAAALAVNAFGVRALARAAEACGAVFVHYGSDFVFDGAASRPYAEDDAPNPQSVYAASKLLGDWFAAGPRHYVLRVESLFGGVDDRPAPGAARRGGSLDRMAEAMLAGREVTAFVDRVVSPTHVDDAAAATVALLRTAPSPGVYHCVGSGHAAWTAVAAELARRLGVEAAIRGITLDELALPARRPRFCALSNRKLAAAGIAMPTWQDAVARYAAARRRPAAPSPARPA